MDMMNSQRTTTSTAENRTSDKETSMIEEQAKGLRLRVGRGGVTMARLRRWAVFWGSTSVPFFRG
jgi:hypothetical protein